MNTRKDVSVFLTCIFGLVLMGWSPAVPASQGVSPGTRDRLALVSNLSPTFSWEAEEEVAYYEIVAYRLPEDVSSDFDLSKENEVLFSRVPGGATSWTPPSDQGFAFGGHYVWFVRAVYDAIDDQAIEASEWSEGLYFQTPEAPSDEDVQHALDVLRRWEKAGGVPVNSDSVSVSVPDSATGPGSGRHHVKSIPTASASIRGEHPATSGETYGVVGSSASPDGAGLAALNTNGGADLVLDGSVDGETDARFWEWGVDRASSSDETFLLNNSGAGKLNLTVAGHVTADGFTGDGSNLSGVVADDLDCVGCVNAAEIADGAVGSSKLRSNSVTNSHLADDAVTATEIAAGAVGYLELADGAVRTGHILDGEVGTNDLADNAVDSSKILNGSVTSSDLSDGTITYRDLADGAVTTVKLAADAVDSSKIASGAIATSDLADDAVTGAKIAAASVAHIHLANQAVETANLAPFAVTSAKIAGDSVDSSRIVDASITSADVANESLTGADITDGSVSSSDIADGSVTSADIADGSITSADIANGTITAGDIANSTITSAEVDPSGGVYSSRSALYSVSHDQTIPAMSWEEVSVSCLDANDLPLHGGCKGASSFMQLVGSIPTHWETGGVDLPTQTCSFSNKSSGYGFLATAIIYCINVPGP